MEVSELKGTIWCVGCKQKKENQRKGLQLWINSCGDHTFCSSCANKIHTIVAYISRRSSR